MTYETLIRDVNARYEDVHQKRKFQDANLATRLLATGVPRFFSWMLRLSPFRVLYVSVMKSHLTPRKLTKQMGWGVRRATTIHPALSKSFNTRKALIVYYSISGNTEKVALAISEGCKRGGLEPTTKKVMDAFDEELYDYDLVCIGTPTIHGLPPHPIMKFMLEKGGEYRGRNEIRINMQQIPGKNAVVFVTFSGPHIGVSEAIPAGKYIKQNLEHFGFAVKGEWYVVGEFHGWKDGSTKGKMGDIRGRPNAEDLAKIEERTAALIKSLKSVQA